MRKDFKSVKEKDFNNVCLGDEIISVIIEKWTQWRKGHPGEATREWIGYIIIIVVVVALPTSLAAVPAVGREPPGIFANSTRTGRLSEEGG